MTERHPLRTPPVETDEQLLERMGTDPAIWASELGKVLPMGFYNAATAIAWFHHAIEAGRKAEREKLTASACDQCGVVSTVCMNAPGADADGAQNHGAVGND